MNEIGREIQRLNSVLARIHEEWVEEMQSKVPYNPDHHSPGSDYGMHHVDMDATWEQEQILQGRQAPFLRRIRELQEAPLDDEGALLEQASTALEFHLAIIGDSVQMLVKHDLVVGLLSYRKGGVWIPVEPSDELPVLDAADLFQVIGQATEIWDQKEGSNLTLSDFQRVALDEI